MHSSAAGQYTYNVACESVPYEWQNNLVLAQKFNTVRLISIVQLVYTILGYGLVLSWYIFSPIKPDIIRILQTPGGISILTIIAAIVLRFRFDAEKSTTQVKVYAVLLGIEMVGWIGKTVYNIRSQISDEWTVEIPSLLYLLADTVFSVILLASGTIEAIKVIMEASKNRYSILSDGNDESPSYRASLDYYPIRRIALLQLALVLLEGYLVVYALWMQGDDFGGLVLLVPAASAFTVFAVILIIFFPKRIGKSVLTYYSVLITVDIIAGVLRVVGGIITQYDHLKGKDDHPTESLFIYIGINTVFPVFLWIMGIIVAYRTRVHIEMDTNITSELDRVFGI